MGTTADLFIGDKIFLEDLLYGKIFFLEIKNIFFFKGVCCLLVMMQLRP